MTKYEIRKFPKVAVILTLAGLFLAVIAMAISLIIKDNSLGGLAIFAIVASVLVLAGLTTGKVLLLKIISTILTVGLLITSFILAIVKFSNQEVVLFAVSILMLVASILELIYFLTNKNPRINQMYIYTGSIFSVLVLAYSIYYAANDIYEVVNYGVQANISNYFLLLSFAAVSYLPVATHRSIEKVEEEPKQEEKPQEDQQ